MRKYFEFMDQNLWKSCVEAFDMVGCIWAFLGSGYKFKNKTKTKLKKTLKFDILVHNTLDITTTGAYMCSWI